jgi:hypothetical protein
MSDLRFTDTNAADDSAGRVFGLEGNLYLPVVGGFVAGVLLRRTRVRRHGLSAGRHGGRCPHCRLARMGFRIPAG